MTAHPPVTLCIVNHNGAKHLRRLFRALAHQAWPFAEVLLVDNASSDSSLAVAQSLCPQARDIQLPDNLGPGAARNAGFRQASNELIIFQDNDILLGDESRSMPYEVHRVGLRSIRVGHQPGPTLMKLFYLDPLLCLRIGRILRSRRFDLIHAHHYEGLLNSLLARRWSHKIPIVYDAHTLLESELPFYARWIPRTILSRFGRMLDLRVPRRADHIISVTDRMRHWFVNVAEIAPECISVIPNGVEHQHFTTENGNFVRSPRAPRVVFAGNLADYQGVDLLLDAFVYLRAELTDAELFLLGGKAPASLLAQLDELGIASSVHFEVPDYISLPARLATADVLVNPRIDCHGIPQKLLNYMATGRPIVSFASSAAVLENERDGLTVADGDIRGFANVILRVMRDPAPARSLGRAANAKVIAGHSWGAVADQVEAIYTRVIESGQ